MVMATVLMSSARKPPSMPQSQENTHTMIGDFTENNVPNSDNYLQCVEFTCARLDGRIPDILHVKIWRTVLLWMFLHSSFFTSLLPYFSICLDLGPVLRASR